MNKGRSKGLKSIGKNCREKFYVCISKGDRTKIGYTMRICVSLMNESNDCLGPGGWEPEEIIENIGLRYVLV